MSAVFRSRADHSPVRSDCPSPERVWDAVRLQMSLDERLEVVDHISVCPTCAEAWSLAAAVERALDATDQPQVKAFHLPTAAMAPSHPASAMYSRRPLLVGTAAVLLVALGIVFSVFRPAAPPRVATESVLSTSVPQPVQATQNPAAAPAAVRPSPAPPAPPTVVETPDLAAARERLARELARARAQTLAGSHAAPANATRDASPSSPVGSDESEIRRVVATFQTAIETQDVSLFLTVRPGLSAKEQERLRAGFQAINAQQITITIEDLQVTGTSAVARISRNDLVIVEGERRQSHSSRQTLHFEKAAAGWIITSIGP